MDERKKKSELALIHKADEIALNSTDHEFHFSKQAALANIAMQYTEDDLAEARKLVESVGVKALGPGYRGSLGKLQGSAALACAIIEQGLSARQADITSQIYAVP
jgi:hypothetical protein